MNYYNEYDKNAAAWLRELIKDGLIAPGTVDERSIADVAPEDLAGFTQCHFFAGIGGWSYALRLAGWPDDRPVWTGSCPCQPFSVAGKGAGTDDERHLWPAFRWLIAQCRPATCFGEQVASADGRQWLSGVRSDLEALGYRVGAADLCAAGVGSPHIRQRLWWHGRLAEDTAGQRRRGGRDGDPTGDQREVQAAGLRDDCVVDWSRSVWWPCRDGKWRRVPARWVGHATGDGRRQCEPGTRQEGRTAVGGTGTGGGLGDEPSGGCGIGWDAAQQGSRGHVDGAEPNGGLSDAAGRQREQQHGAQGDGVQRSANGDADDASRHDRLEVEPALFPLADGLPGRVGLLRGAGNAIVPQVAARFIEATCRCWDQ